MGQEIETDGDVIAQQAYAELEAEQNGQPLPESKKPTAEAEKPVEEQPSEEAVKPSEEEVKESAEGQEGEKPAEETPKEEAKPEVKDESDKDVVQDHALKHGMTYAEAKEDIEKTNAIIEKYKGDPIEMARALRSTQSAYDKVKTQIEGKPREQIFRRLSDDQVIKEARAHLNKEKEKHVELFREKNPAKSEMMSDEAIIEELAERTLPAYKKWADEKEASLRQSASDKREKILSELPESDKKFLPDVKAVIYKTADYQILDENFDVRDIVHWAKGQRYDADIKAAEERGYKRAKESAVIIGAKEVPGGSKPKVGSGQSSGTGLDINQKKRALEMYPTEDTGNEERSYQLFRETYADELKKNPRFF